VRLGRGPQPRPLAVGPVLAAGPPHRQAGRRPWPWATQVLVIAWHLRTNDCDYHELGGDSLVGRDTDRARQRAVGQLQASAARSPSNPRRLTGDSPFRMKSQVQALPGPRMGQ
jgi:hypothetical protein